jgi:hypothetical protein
MPRFKHRRRLKPTREHRIRVLVDDGIVVGTYHPILADLPEAERAAILSEAVDLCYAERHAHSLPILRERLRQWPVEMWGNLFCQAPELLGELTPSQRLAWDAWQEGTPKPSN